MTHIRTLPFSSRSSFKCKSSGGPQAFASATPPLVSDSLPRTPSPLPPKAIDSAGFAAYSGVKSPFAFASNASTKTKGSLSSALQGPSKSVLGQGLTETASEDNSQALESISKGKENVYHKPGEAAEQSKTSAFRPLSEAELITGEENEDLKAKLKGVRLFKVKGTTVERSLVGEIKLLEDRTTHARRLGKVPLLFRCLQRD
jgi:hypothetical protein